MACCFTLGAAGWGTDTMKLKRDDMYIISKDNFGVSDTKIPYGELESVDFDKECCCCHSVRV
jgi:hypothetical protein